MGRRLGKATAEFAILVYGLLKVAEDVRANSAPANVISHGLGEQPRDALVGLAGERLERLPLCLFHLGG